MYTPRSIAYIALVITAGVMVIGRGLWTWTSTDPARYLSYLLLAIAASGTKIRLPAVLGTASLGFLFALISIAEFSLGESLLLGCLGILLQSCFHTECRPRLVQVSFNLASMACAIDIAYVVQHTSWLHSGLLTAAALFAGNTLSVAMVIALTERKSVWNVWRGTYFWTFPNYLVGAATVWVIGAAERRFGWQAGVLLLPVAYIVYRSHRAYLDRLDEARQRDEQRAAHAAEMAGLHRRTIETLALAVEAKDQTTGDHLQRVERYAVEIGREMGLNETELEALRAAALLHDVGKVAVPEHIIAKPGKLTPEEFEKMKIHTVVGAEIVERIRFPYDVASMVRGHHERWNGAGYPDGLAGEQIPIGARILAAVDCLDALVSDRQYRRALPMSEAIAFVKSESGKCFDPAVVAILARRCGEVEAMAMSEWSIAKLPAGVRVERGDAPAAGFQKIASIERAIPEDATSGALAGNAMARDLSALNGAIGQLAINARAVPELTARFEQCDTREAVLATLHASLREIVRYNVMVLYIRRGNHLSPEFVDGQDFELFGSRPNRIGAGLSGWVAENSKAIVNGNPDVEAGYWNDRSRFDNLLSALAVPLTGPNGTAGVLSLYRKDRDAFTSANLAALTALSPGLAGALESTAGTIVGQFSLLPQPIGFASPTPCPDPCAV